MIKIPQKIEYVLENIRKNGYEAYIVGGCVRDMMLGKNPTDFDVTTSAKPETVMSIFEKTIPTGIKHGTVTVLADGDAVEVTTYRTDGGYTDNRHPESVSFVSSLKEDLARRDFTVNAIAYNKQDGIVDYFGGISDLENRILRAVGEPERRFNEDALRILRLFRFSSVLKFSIEPETETAALNLSGNLKNISRERIAAELKKAVVGENFKVFSSLINIGGLAFLGIDNCSDFELIKKCSDNANLAFFAFITLCSCDINAICKELKLSNRLRDYLLNMELLAKNDLPANKTELKIQLKSALSENNYRDFLKLKSYEGENIQNAVSLLDEIIQNQEPYLISHLALNGNDLISLGISGEKVGKTLKELLGIVVENPQENTKENLKNHIKNL